jgi:hypothetical protein
MQVAGEGGHSGIRRMRGPSTPRGWLNFAASVTASYRRTHSARLENEGWTDRRVSDVRESAISIIRLCEKSANGNGGAGLLYSFYVEEVSWYAFTGSEQAILRKTIRQFSLELRKAGFLPDREHGEEEDRSL